MKSRILSLIVPRLQDLLFIGIFVAVMGAGQRMLNADGDLPRHLVTGKLILQSRAIPTSEPFIYPYAGKLYVSHEWLSDVTLYLVQRYFGLEGIVIQSGLLLAVTFTLLYAILSKRLNHRIPIFILVSLGAAATSLNWVTRPHLFSMFFLAIWLIEVDRLARGEKVPLWLFPAFMVIWSNFHGEFIAGVLVMGAYTAGWTWDYAFDREKSNVGLGKNLWIALIISIGASLLNPAGVQPWTAILGFVNNRYLMSMMTESNPPNFQQPVFLILLALLMLSILLLAMKKTRLSAGHALLLAGFSAMSLLAGRNIHLYGIVAPFVLAESLAGIDELKFLGHFEDTLRNMEVQVTGWTWSAAMVLVYCLLLTFGNVKQSYAFDPSVFPVDAISWLEKNPQGGRMFNDLNWGGYIAWRLWPHQSAFIDSIADGTVEAKTQGKVTTQYVSVITLSDKWQDIFTQYDVNWTIVPPQSKLAETLRKNYGWTILYEDNTAVILRR